MGARVIAVAVMVVAGVVLAAGCGQYVPTAPTTTGPPVTSAPPLTSPPVAPTETPPPVPVPPPVPATPYSGRWEGRYVIARCDGTGSMQDVMCSTQRGFYPPGTSLPITVDLTQSGSTVSGVITLGRHTGVVSGAVRSSGLLTLSGSARFSSSLATITYWDTVASGTAMEGYFNFNATLDGIPGVADVVTRLSGLAKK